VSYEMLLNLLHRFHEVCI